MTPDHAFTATMQTPSDHRFVLDMLKEAGVRLASYGWDMTALGWNVWTNRKRLLSFIVSATIEADGKRWVHLSVSHRDRIPTWAELLHVKEVVLGDERAAVQVLPRKSEYVNINPRVLHLWHCVDGDPTPDFRRDGAV